ncbi:MAG TPA: DUF1269 domain-containing protein [Chloroflexota bacterium]|nr:DUF1269 domain-containing protein [Chloroflexota bacterium]
MTSAPVNAKVLFADDTWGEVQTVVVHRLSHKVTHVVVRGPARRMRPDGKEHIARLVPIDQVERVDHGTVKLKCTMAEFLELEPFIEERVELVSYPDYQHSPIDSTGMPLGPTMMESYYVTEATERIPEDELGVQVGTKIESRDGEEVGHLAELVVTPDTGEVTHFVLERDEKQTSLPLTVIQHAGRDTIYLTLDKKAVEQLPSVPARPKGGGWEGSDIEMVALVCDSQAQADDVMKFVRDLHAQGTIRVRNAALLTKAQDGTITVKERHDLDAKNGAIGGMVLGGVLGLMTGGIGLIAAPAIGAGLGAVTGRVVDRGFDDSFLKSLAERMQPGRSGLLLIVQSEWRVPLHEALKGRGGIILQQELTDRLIAELTAEQAGSPPTA